MACSSEGDIEQPEIFAVLLVSLKLQVLAESDGRSPHVDRHVVAVVGVVEDRDRHGVFLAKTVPHVGAVNDREFETFAPVDREHLNSLGV